MRCCRCLWKRSLSVKRRVKGYDVKRLFWADSRENLKRRSWTVLVGALALFLALPVRLALKLSVEGRRIAENPFLAGRNDEAGMDGDAFMQIVSNGWFEFLVFLLALLFAVQGFSWLDSRRKLDLYLSVPVSPRRRFAVVYGNGAAVFAVCYFVMLLLVLPAAGGDGRADGRGPSLRASHVPGQPAVFSDLLQHSADGGDADGETGWCPCSPRPSCSSMSRWRAGFLTK